MTFDSDIANVLDYHQSRHEDADHETDMEPLAHKLGYGYVQL
ncbi:hypothetical protein [Deinococcus humi]|uniref:Uncharacterized protein n=1 Tax=Deinococcus humi TaxID=662880 RepID=A0A7W8JX87_9DEIO|nr:hypothetical protein [Deinococcus humi]MBB5363588.1 hypothetical protein [Deinococcus humi]